MGCGMRVWWGCAQYLQPPQRGQLLYQRPHVPVVALRLAAKIPMRAEGACERRGGRMDGWPGGGCEVGEPALGVIAGSYSLNTRPSFEHSTPCQPALQWSSSACHEAITLLASCSTCPFHASSAPFSASEGRRRGERGAQRVTGGVVAPPVRSAARRTGPGAGEKAEAATKGPGLTGKIDTALSGSTRQLPRDKQHAQRRSQQECRRRHPAAPAGLPCPATAASRCQS